MQKFKDLENAIASAKDEAEKFYNKGNKTAGTRLRASMLNIKNIASEIRKEVSELKKA